MEFSIGPLALTVSLALLSGIGGTLIWEGLLRPRRVRNNVARIIAAEVGINVQLLRANLQLRKAHPGSVEPDLVLTRSVFDSVADTVGELEPAFVERILQFYLNVDHLNRVNLALAEAIAELQATSDLELRERAEVKLYRAYEASARLSRDGILLGADLIAALHSITRRLPTFVADIEPEELGGLVQEIEALQRAAADRLRASAATSPTGGGPAFDG